jgi:spore coat protein U-like protein
MSHITKLAAVAVIAGAAATSALAGSPATTSFQVTASVINDCVINSTPIAFGNYDPTGTGAVQAQGSVTAKCTKGDSVSVALGQGANQAAASTAAVPVRQMVSSGSLLPYHIYIAAPTGTGSTLTGTEWGTGTLGTNEPLAQVSASVGTALTFTTYGAILPGVDVPAGSYLDTVVATVTF